MAAGWILRGSPHPYRDLFSLCPSFLFCMSAIGLYFIPLPFASLTIVGMNFGYVSCKYFRPVLRLAL